MIDVRQCTFFMPAIATRIPIEWQARPKRRNSNVEEHCVACFYTHPRRWRFKVGGWLIGEEPKYRSWSVWGRVANEARRARNIFVFHSVLTLETTRLEVNSLVLTVVWLWSIENSSRTFRRIERLFVRANLMACSSHDPLIIINTR